MEETMQFNVRLPKKLVYDMEFIAQNLNISRNDWLKVRIAELISKEIEKTKLSIMETAEGRYILGLITAEEFTQRMGFKPTKEMMVERERQISLSKRGKLSAKKYILDIAKKADTSRK
jgi:hypothetical protein|tara:strand:+ start:1830 stop:2183 length:354 start_codon:yes stop_codon:yes gene_type:complete